MLRQSHIEPSPVSVAYTYGNTQWGDLLTAYNGVTITHDAIGNPLNDGIWTYTWQHGRELASMAKTGETWSFTYNADGLRTKRTSGGRTYQYTYVGSQLTNMTVDGHNINIFYDTNGSPVMMNLDGAFYYYVTNLQGDVVNLLNSSGEEVVRYVYDAWGNIISTTGTKADTVGLYNPLRYRGYVYDPETELYYLQSRYYNPEQGRFINADGLASTGQGLVGNNMFAYCGNNPVNNKDAFGMRYCAATTVSAESAYDRFIACDWQKKVALEKDNPTPIGTTDKGKVYLVQQESSIKTTFPGDIVVIDMRNSTISNDDPYVQIKNSALIRDRETQMQILEVLNQYETRNPSRWERNVDNASILLEWDAHNHIYSFWANTRCLHVDVNNGDRSVTYFGYWWRAIRETLGI